MEKPTANGAYITEMSTRDLPGGEGQQVCKADNLTTICEPTV
jgi:hypothetical protein